MLARPLAFGGWGIKHLPWFSVSLSLSSFWKALNGSGIWNHVLSAKYLKEKSLADWFRGKHFAFRNSSIVWNGFIKTLPWIGRCLSWKVGNGLDVRIDADPIIGVSLCIFFDHGLISYLCDYVISSLQRA